MGQIEDILAEEGSLRAEMNALRFEAYRHWRSAGYFAGAAAISGILSSGFAYGAFEQGSITKSLIAGTLCLATAGAIALAAKGYKALHQSEHAFSLANLEYAYLVRTDTYKNAALAAYGLNRVNTNPKDVWQAD